MTINVRDFFSIHVPLELVKGGVELESEARGRIGGVISTTARDFQGETLDQEGLDFDYFLKHGWFNWEHQPGPENILGYPDRVVRKGDHTRVEGWLYLDRPKAREVYETARAMVKGGSERSLGFSVEGQVLLRDPRNPKRVQKARVLNTAITAHPVNPGARVELLKSLAAASAGYQTPASGGGSMGPLMSQSLEGTVSVADLRTALRRHFPRLTDREAMETAERIFRQRA